MDLFMLFLLIQDTVIVQPPEDGGAVFNLLLLIVPVVVGFITVYAMKILKAITTFIHETVPETLGRLIKIDGFPVVAQRLVVFLVAAGLTALGKLLSLPIPTDLLAIGESDMTVILTGAVSAVLAMIFHKIGKKGTNAN